MIPALTLSPNEHKLEENKPYFDDPNVFVVFETEEKMQEGVHALQKEGFNGTEIKLFEVHGGNLLWNRRVSKLGEGLIAGVILGVLSGMVLSFWFHLSILSQLEPEIYQRFSALLAGGLIGGMVGGPIGAILGLMLPELKVERYNTSLHDCSVLVDVVAVTRPRASLARRTLVKNGGFSVSIPQIISRPREEPLKLRPILSGT